MDFDCAIRTLRPEELDAARELVWRVFLAYEAPDYPREGAEEFYKSIHEEAYLSTLCWYGAFAQERLLGVLATRNAGAHIALFFVDGQYHRRGIGKRLFQAARRASPCGRMTVHASPYAVPVYHRLGFRDTDTEQTFRGLRFTPMALPAREKEEPERHA